MQSEGLFAINTAAQSVFLDFGSTIVQTLFLSVLHSPVAAHLRPTAASLVQV